VNELHLFAGAGGGILGGQILGHSTVCAVEIEEYPRQVLLQRQRDGVLPKFPIWDDVCTFDGKPWRGTVDVICGGFPCQDISSAGKGAGIAGKRSGLWKEYARIIDEVRPKFVFAENSPLLRGRGLEVVLGDLSELGYDAKWCVLGAWHVGAPHKRNRMWVLAYAKELQCNGSDNNARVSTQPKEISELRDSGGAENLAYAVHSGLQGSECAKWVDPQGRKESDGSTAECSSLWWSEDPAEGTTEPVVGRVANGVANRVHRLKAIGNGQVPAVAATAWNILSQ
jgi:DNA (cytosine-5)-methyltransferase 1